MQPISRKNPAESDFGVSDLKLEEIDMRKCVLPIVAVLAGILAITLNAAPARAQAVTRTWVSGSIGDDGNVCSVTSPCKTFGGAISKTAVGGEINCLDSGGFGALTITKAIAIICDSVEGGVLVTGSNGIIVSAASTDVVYLSGLDIEGLGSVGNSLNGVLINSAAVVHVVNSTIRGFISPAPNGNAIGVVPSSGTVNVFVENTRMELNGLGVEVHPTGSGSAHVTVERSFANNHKHAGFRALATSTSGTINLMIKNCQASGNAGAGVIATGAGATVKVGYSVFANNAGGDIGAGGGIMQSFGNNQVSDGSTPSVIPLR
jgi:hypothetical protein